MARTVKDIVDMKKNGKKISVLTSYDYALAVFFLPEPPKEATLTDYRIVGGVETEKLSKKTFAAIKNARYVQSNAKELLKLRSQSDKPKINKVTLDNDPEEIAEIERKNLELRFEEESSSGRVTKKPINQVYNNLREKIESLNIFVMQATMPVDEARGFSLTDKYPRIILVNSADQIKPRIFTLLHEYAHILLRKDGICVPNSENFRTKSKNEIQTIEKWCNAFAGSLLMPKHEFLTEFYSNEEIYDEPKKIVFNLSSRFSVSKKAVVVRILNLLRDQSYKDAYLPYYDKIIFEPTEKPKKKKSGGALPQADKCLNQKGRKYVRLVSNSRSEKLITSNNMISYLDLKIKHFDKLNSKL